MLWRTIFPSGYDVDVFTLMPENGILRRLIPDGGPPMPNHWLSRIRHVPYYRTYRPVVDIAMI